jgi:hypothetical protein
MLLPGCSIGHLANSKLIDPYDMPEKLEVSLPPLPASGIPRAAIARSCRSDSKPLAAVRPGVGSMLNLTIWSSGVMPELVAGRGNAGPPPVDAMTLALRMVEPGTQLDAAEQRVLSTFLITNRESWHNPGGGQGDITERLKLAAAVREHQATLWNALVGSLCVEVWHVNDKASAPGRGIALVALADMSSLCRALPAGLQDSFARAFLDAATPSCKGVVYKGLAGLLEEAARSDWAAGALDSGPRSGESARYFATGAQASIMVMGGGLMLNSVRPGSHDAPNWSLAAWESSGICRTPDDVRTHIASVRLVGGVRSIKVIDLADGLQPTHKIVNDGVAMRLEKIHDRWVFPSIARADLTRLGNADVAQLNWVTAAAYSAPRPVEPAGCVHIR